MTRNGPHVVTQSAGRRVVAGLLAVSLAPAALASCGSEQRPGADPHRASAVVRPAPRAVWKAFAAFRSTAEPLPITTARAVQMPAGGGSHLAQRLRAPEGMAVWAVAGRRELCLVSQAATGAGATTETCTSIARALVHGVFFSSLSATAAAPAITRLVVGMVPDGIQRVHVLTGAESRLATVTGNVFIVSDRAPEPADRVLPVS